MIKKIFILFFFFYSSLYGDWNEYKTLFITDDGRVMDKTNKNITTSESIGYGMYLALIHEDTKTFEKIYKWYHNNLPFNKDGLIPWKWGESANGEWKLLDDNSASDGDLWITYCNLLIYEKTKEERYKKEAFFLMQNIKKSLLSYNGDHVLLLPAEKGFETKEKVIVNLSYYLFFIFEKFTEYDKDRVWKQLQREGSLLIQKARFTPLALNADWVSIQKKDFSISLAKNKSFGYDALRIPLNIIKSSLPDKNKLLAPYKHYIDAMKAAGTIFGTVNLQDGVISIYNYSYAQVAIYRMIEKYFTQESIFEKKFRQIQGEHKDDYYAYSIYLFTVTD
jgi:endoglucanase